MISQKSSALPYIAVNTTAAICVENDDITSTESLYFQSIWKYLTILRS
jgi:hypothetical protein